jgi:tetratricopeptide (TPR) repeat protein
MRAGALVAIAMACALTSATSYAAPPNIWQRAKRAANGERVEAQERALKQALVEDLEAELDADPEHALAKRQLAIFALEASKAQTSTDARVVYTLADLYERVPMPTSTGDVERCERAVPLFKRALELAPKASWASNAWFSIAICASKSRDHAAESSAYASALAVEREPRKRAMIYGNLAESRMALGQLPEALVAAEAAVELDDEQPLHHWTLAVVRDRGGDFDGAVVAAIAAVTRDPIDVDGKYLHLDGPGVFFEPEFDRHWYYALGDLARAERASVAADSKRLREAARAEYDAYVSQAASDDRFRAIAEARSKRITELLARTAPPKKK